jgi:Aldehyde dehydrogenase family
VSRVSKTNRAALSARITDVAPTDAAFGDAVEKGAKILTGGVTEVLGGGLYMRPTVVTEVDHTMRLMRDETFGPILPVMRYPIILQRSNERAAHLARVAVALSYQGRECFLDFAELRHPLPHGR